MGWWGSYNESRNSWHDHSYADELHVTFKLYYSEEMVDIVLHSLATMYTERST